jgi:predicted Ser/Thr protein kinase
MEEFFKNLLKTNTKKDLKFSEFIDKLVSDPEPHLKTSTKLVLDAVKHFGYTIRLHSGKPFINYKVFGEMFLSGSSAIYGQEECIKYVLDIIDSVNKEAGPNRGIILVGPPGSGKTNIIELIAKALEEYTKIKNHKLYTFYFQFKYNKKKVEIRPPFMHNPLLLFPTISNSDDDITVSPRNELFKKITEIHPDLIIPSFYKNANLDKLCLDVIETLVLNNPDKSLFDILEEYIIIEEIDLSVSQGRGISNIDEMKSLRTSLEKYDFNPEDQEVIKKVLPGFSLYKYNSSIIKSNRGVLHIHDAFEANNSNPLTESYKPLLMLLGSAKTNVESTQVNIDNIVMLTTNLQEMESVDYYLSSAKLLDRVERIPVNYLLDPNSEADILKRDIGNIDIKYDIDPNLFKIASYFSVMTRLKAPMEIEDFPDTWSPEKVNLYDSITPEQKLYIYASKTDDPINLINNLDPWDSFRNECKELDIDLSDPEKYISFIENHPDSIDLKSCGLFTVEEVDMIDDEFKRILKSEHYPEEGKSGISVRQLQNIMMNTISKTDGNKITVEIFLNQLKDLLIKGKSFNNWIENVQERLDEEDGISYSLPARCISKIDDKYSLEADEGNFGDLKGIVKIIERLYWMIIRSEITISILDRDPESIEYDLRKYIQNVMLDSAIKNKSFSHVLIPKYTFIDGLNGEKIEEPNYEFMESIEKILIKSDCIKKDYRKNIANKYSKAVDNMEIDLNEGKNIISSQSDGLIKCFMREYNELLSHTRSIGNIDVEKIKNAFYHKQNGERNYNNYSEDIKKFVKKVINNMINNFDYSEEIALDVIVYSLKKSVIDLNEIIKK